MKSGGDLQRQARNKRAKSGERKTALFLKIEGTCSQKTGSHPALIASSMRRG
jgi:hypothetical protein